jgi:NAD(P)-dependent dehydrogenase (short-subunit alcohol dehydrogenase family)
MSCVYHDLQGKVVLITGGANGIGESLVRSFVSQGALVYFCDQDKESGRRLAEETGSVFCRVDLTKEHAIKRWVDSIKRQEPTLHVLINNAANDPRIPLQSMTSRQWDDLFAINLRAYFLTTQSVLPAMARGGSIINFSSITFHIGATPMTAYVATKGGILGFTRSLAREVGPSGIRVNTISPGWVMTERQKSQFVTPAIRRMLRQCQCVPELIQPEEIAQVALFLASDVSGVLTGQEILADRGWAYS